MKVKLGELTKIRTGKLDANASSPDGEYPFFTCSKEPLKISSYSYDCECVLVAGNGDLNVKYYNGKFDAYQRTYIIEDNSNGRLYLPYLYYFMNGYVEELRKLSIGGVIKYIKLRNLTDALIELPDIETQKYIVSILSKIKELIDSRYQELKILENLIKARFVELFGDQTTNPYGWQKASIGACCTLKSGTSLPADKENEGGAIPYVKVSDMNYPGNEQYITTSSRFVSEQTAGTGVFPVGTVVFPKRGGAIGTNKKRLTRIPICADLNVMGVTAGIRLTPQYLMAYFNNIDLGTLNNGSSVPQINNKDIAPLLICLPPMVLQEQFADFVSQIDKSKLLSGCRLFHSWAPENRDKPKHVGVPRRRTKVLRGCRRQQ